MNYPSNEELLGVYKEPWEGFPHILNTRQFSREFIEKQMRDTIKILFHIKNKSLVSFLSGQNKKTICHLFYEPSTRTRLSFNRATQLLGAELISTENAKDFSSAIKGETSEDTARVISGSSLGVGYADAIVIRHYLEGEVDKFATKSRIPIINAGDGGNQHPTQALLDINTIFFRFGKIDGLKIAMVGDNKNGRTVRSLCYLLSKFHDIKIYFCSPEEVKMKDDIKDYLAKKDISFVETEKLEDVLPEVDVVYNTRVQAERFKEADLYEVVKQKAKLYAITENNINLLKENSIVLHPLPIGDEEISEGVKSDSRVWPFVQSDIGVATRMALLNRIFKEIEKQKMFNNFHNIYNDLCFL
ncbi:MAG: aspartate carbamoyltransferase [Planctomycetes bacterium]|jgi:aspartate carbamoyltransferase catalytic subunit|nr:aspartate carbamoyltransferase [Planctomycetota bacterium]